MNPLVLLFWDICLLRRGPQDTPDSGFLLWLAVAGNFLVGLAILALAEDTMVALLEAGLGVLLMAGYLLGTLAMAKKLHRARQTLIAALSCDALISLITLPLAVARAFWPELRGTLLPLDLLAMCWQLLVLGHILRHAVGTTLSAGLGLALMYAALTIGIMIELFPPF